MKKYIIKASYIEYIYAENEEDALEQFDEITSNYVSADFDEIEVKEENLPERE